MRNQNELIQNVLYHCAHFSPYYREQNWAKKVRAGKRLRLRNIPVTPRDALRDNTAHFYSDRSFPADGEIFTKYTSGSTGEPMAVKLTSLSHHVNMQENERLNKGWWRKSDISSALILKLPSEEKPFGSLEKVYSKPSHPDWVFFCLDAQTALETIIQRQPEFLSAYPSLTHEILKFASREGTELSLKFLSTIGETISDEFKYDAEVRFGCKLYDAYGSVETGLIAARCVHCGEYHPADQNIIVEILRDNGNSVRPGETGNVVLTPLFNSAMPLIRYDIGDLATLSAKKCPKSKLVISRIVGRTRSMFKMANGKAFTPMLPAEAIAKLDIIKFKLIQTSHEELEFHYIPFNPQDKIENVSIQALVDRYLDPSMKVKTFKQHTIPLNANGKYMMHESFV